MKKSIICFLLSILMVLPLFTACGGDYEEEETEANVYTLYTICDESTTKEAIREVELALNRILFFRSNVILDLRMVTEEQYDDFLASEFTKMEEYMDKLTGVATEDEANGENTDIGTDISDDLSVDLENSDSSDESVEEGVTGPASEIISGDDILKMLEKGDKDIEDLMLDTPRVDIFLVRGYDNYYKLATEGKLYALDSALNIDAIELTTCINTTLFTASKVNGKSYGIPVNTAVGVSSYMVFDKELLNKYNINIDTIKTMEDLQGYLQILAENEPDVVPLKNVIDSAHDRYLFNNGFPAVVNNKTLSNAYADEKIKNYFALIAKYNNFGYFANANGEANEDSRYAVRIETGDIDDIQRELGTDAYEYVRYTKPIATNDSAVENIFCVNSRVDPDEFKHIMTILEEINTDAQLLNLLTYGVEGLHYKLNDEGQVERTDVMDGDVNKPYIVNPSHIGNCFIAYTLAGENPNKWQSQIDQNKDAVASPSLGFTKPTYSTELSFNVTKKDGDNEIVETITVTVEEPDYVTLLNGVVSEHYTKLMSGTAITVDYATILAEAEAEIRTEKTEEFNKNYNNVFEKKLNDSVREGVINNESAAIRENAIKNAKNEWRNKAKDMIMNKEKLALQKEFPDLSDAEIKAKLAEIVTDAYIDEKIANNQNDYYTDADLQKAIDAHYTSGINTAINNAKKNLTAAAKNKIKQEIESSAEYLADKERLETYIIPDSIPGRVDAKINALINEYNNAVIAEINTVIETTVNEWITTILTDNNIEDTEEIRTEILVAMGYLKKEVVEAPAEGEGDGTEDSSTESSDDASTESSEDASTESSEDVSADSSEDASAESSEDASAESSEDASADSSDESTDAEDPDNGEEDGEEEPEYVFTNAFESWLDFVLKGRLEITYQSIFGKPL